MASLLNISPDSVKVARYRLRKKLPLETEEHLGEFLSQIEKNYKNSEHTWGGMKQWRNFFIIIMLLVFVDRWMFYRIDWNIN